MAISCLENMPKSGDNAACFLGRPRFLADPATLESSLIGDDAFRFVFALGLAVCLGVGWSSAPVSDSEARTLLREEAFVRVLGAALGVPGLLRWVLAGVPVRFCRPLRRGVASVVTLISSSVRPRRGTIVVVAVGGASAALRCADRFTLGDWKRRRFTPGPSSSAASSASTVTRIFWGDIWLPISSSNVCFLGELAKE